MAGTSSATGQGWGDGFGEDEARVVSDGIGSGLNLGVEPLSYPLRGVYDGNHWS